MEILTSKDNASVKRLGRLLSSKKERDKEGLFVCEGAKLCQDGMASGQIPCELYVSETAAQKYTQLYETMRQSGKTVLLSDSIAMKISDTPTPQGIFAVFKKLDNTKSAVKIKSGGNYIILCSLQDPGNIGSIIRSCEAFGINGLIVSADCPDLYGSKVLRASMGGVFRLPVYICDDVMDYIGSLRSHDVKVYAAALTHNAVPLSKIMFDTASAVVIGNEGGGLPDEIVRSCDSGVIIPMCGGAQSLNAGVAAGILIWEMTRYKRK